MYRAFTQRRVRAIFDALSAGDYAFALGGLAEDVCHVFAGEHALGGERHSRDAVQRWFERLSRLYEELRFEIRRVSVCGPPWKLTVCVEWLVHARPKAGEPYINEGAHVIEIRRGRVVYLHAYEDSQKVAAALGHMADAGINEAAAAPVIDERPPSDEAAIRPDPRRSVHDSSRAPATGHPAVHVAERKHNPFVRSTSGGRVLSALQLPWFTVLPPRGFGVITTIGRRTGKTRRKCVRAIRSGNKAYLVSIGGSRAAWMKNIRADPNVRLRIRGGTFVGHARDLRDETETQAAMATYCQTLNLLDYVECALHRPGRPSRAKITQLHRAWFEKGSPLVIELRQ